MRAESIMQTTKECYVCGAVYPLQKHHLYFGVSNRKMSEKYGCWVWLCVDHHVGNHGVHQDRDLDLKLKRGCQEILERKWTREKFIKTFGRSYL